MVCRRPWQVEGMGWEWQWPCLPGGGRRRSFRKAWKGPVVESRGDEEDGWWFSRKTLCRCHFCGCEVGVLPVKWEK
jgi:hypothetical protein